MSERFLPETFLYYLSNCSRPCKPLLWRPLPGSFLGGGFLLFPGSSSGLSPLLDRRAMKEAPLRGAVAQSPLPLLFCKLTPLRGAAAQRLSNEEWMLKIEKPDEYADPGRGRSFIDRVSRCEAPKTPGRGRSPKNKTTPTGVAIDSAPHVQKVSYWKSFASIRQIVLFPTGNISLLSVKLFTPMSGEKN